MNAQRSSRFVTTELYLQLQMKRIGLISFVAFLTLVVSVLVVSLVIPIVCFVGGIVNMDTFRDEHTFPGWRSYYIYQAIISAVSFLIMVLLVLALAYWATVTARKARSIDPGIPLTS